ncbi:ankyrin repeat-containing domain protein [Gaertneriomyces semiglobifer]|nr:ankyrin repeat-containing domain protein [Gaertneriomyces semiglobifer]
MPEPEIFKSIYHSHLHTAIATGNIHLTKRYFHRFKLPLQCPDPQNGWPTLFYAIKYHQNEIVRYLLEVGHEEPQISFDFEGRTALHVACESHNVEAFELYYEKYPSTLPMATYTTGLTPLHLTTIHHLPLLALILRNVPNSNPRDKTGSTPLHHAAAYGHTDHIKLLIHHGAEFNTKNATGWTPFDYAWSLSVRAYLQECASAKAQDLPLPDPPPVVSPPPPSPHPIGSNPYLSLTGPPTPTTPTHPSSQPLHHLYLPHHSKTPSLNSSTIMTQSSSTGTKLDLRSLF